MKRLICLVGLFLLVSAAFAQSDRGTITGTVSDPAGAVIAGAVIEARNIGNGAVYPVASSGTGNYTIAQLPAGAYDLSVTVPASRNTFARVSRLRLQAPRASTSRWKWVPTPNPSPWKPPLHC